MSWKLFWPIKAKCFIREAIMIPALVLEKNADVQTIELELHVYDG